MRNRQHNKKRSEFRPEDFFLFQEYILPTVSFTVTIKMSNLLNLNPLWAHEYIKSIYSHLNLTLKSNLKLPRHLNVYDWYFTTTFSC